MKLTIITNLLRIVTLLLVSALLIGHGTPNYAGKTYDQSWVLSSNVRVEFDLSPQVPVRRFLIEVNTEGYKPKNTITPIWVEKLFVHGINGTVKPKLIYKLENSIGNVRYERRSFYSDDMDKSTFIFATLGLSHKQRQNSPYNPIVVSCVNDLKKSCKASGILEVRLADSTEPGVKHIALDYVATFLGPKYCTNCNLDFKSRKPSDAKVSLRFNEQL